MDNLEKSKGDINNFIPNKSIFPDGRALKWAGGASTLGLLGDVFVELGEKKRDELHLKHMTFQHLLDFYSFDSDIKTFLERNGFLLLEVFYDLQDLKRFILNNKSLYADVRSGEISIALLFDGFIPVGVVLAKKVESDEKINENIKLLTQDFARRIYEILESRGLVL